MLVHEWDVELQPGTRHVSGRAGNDQSDTGHEAQTSEADGHALTRRPSITTGVSEAGNEMSFADMSGNGAVLTI